MTHDNHTRCRSSFRKSERARDPELGIWTRECVLASALYTMTVDGGRGTVSARLALQQTRNFSAGDHSTLQEREEVWDARLKHTRIWSSSMTTTHALSFRKSGDPEPGTSWTRVCVKVVLPSSYRPWRRAYRYGPDTGGSMRQSEQGPSRPAYDAAHARR